MEFGKLWEGGGREGEGNINDLYHPQRSHQKTQLKSATGRDTTEGGKKRFARIGEGAEERRGRGGKCRTFEGN